VHPEIYEEAREDHPENRAAGVFQTSKQLELGGKGKGAKMKKQE